MARVVVVTGGGTGFGRAVAERFAADGDRVVITGRRGDVLADAAAALGDRVTGLVCDGTDPEAVARTTDAIGGHVDVLVNNAGGNAEFGDPGIGGLEGTVRRWRANFDANVLTAVLMTEALGSALASGGAVVHIGSIGAEQGGSYGAAKAALAAWSAGIADDLGARGITSNVVAPGYFPGTEFFGGGLPTERHRALIERTSVGRHGEVGEIADAVYFLASPAARYITGTVVAVNGGAHKTR